MRGLIHWRFVPLDITLSADCQPRLPRYARQKISTRTLQAAYSTGLTTAAARICPGSAIPAPTGCGVSEIMLQQTQVKTVIPYFERLCRPCPPWRRSPRHREDEVLHLWTGRVLRPRPQLHRAAQQVCAELGAGFRTPWRVCARCRG